MTERKDAKIGLGIIAFDDTCHLKSIVSELRDLCDEIVICLQKESWHGDPIEQEVVDYVDRLLQKKFIDDVIWFESENDYDDKDPAKPRMIETDKRNFLLDFMQEKGCTHAHVIDSDEFYDHDDYKNTIDVILQNDIKVTYCQYINYYRDYCHVLVWPFLCYVPFISDIHYRFDFKNGSFDKPSDPTRRYKLQDGEQYCILSFKLIKMHHLSWIRKNIEDKIKNWSAKRYFENIENLKEKVIDRYNNYKDGQNAIILFNTPEYNVVVNRLNDAYIKPKYSLLEDIV